VCSLLYFHGLIVWMLIIIIEPKEPDSSVYIRRTDVLVGGGKYLHKTMTRCLKDWRQIKSYFTKKRKLKKQHTRNTTTQICGCTYTGESYLNAYKRYINNCFEINDRHSKLLKNFFSRHVNELNLMIINE
jgi:hypothetical protein